MAYTGNPSTNAADAIRLLIGDTSTSTGSEIFSDAEIDYFNAAKPNAFFAAALAVESILGSTRADNLSNALSSKKVDGLALSFRSGAAQGSYLTLREKVKMLRLEGARGAKPYLGGVSQSDKEAKNDDTDRVMPAFRRGQFANPSVSTSTFR